VGPDGLFSLDDVFLARAGRPVLAGLTLRIEHGSTAVVGPSGAGKSTLLRLLNRLADPDRGAVRLEGRPLVDYDVLELRRTVALVPQLPALLPGTVADNVRFAARLARRTAPVAELLQATGLDASFAERDSAALSVGEQQRAMLARALAQRPRVLLLDEPTSALDHVARDAIEATLAELRREVEVSLIVVSHDPEQARRLADWALRLDGGRVAACGTLEEALG
jgi:putative ABC transport system ATP-binding protein